jgi:hypothetical protein
MDPSASSKALPGKSRILRKIVLAGLAAYLVLSILTGIVIAECQR